MKGQVNMNGVQESPNAGEFILIPEGEYLMKIIQVKDKETESGDPMVSIRFTPVDSEFQERAFVWDNIVIPMPNSPAIKILGRTKHFLHCIGEPYEGDFVTYDSENWLYKTCVVKVKHELPNKHHKNIKAVVDGYILDAEEGLLGEEESPL